MKRFRKKIKKLVKKYNWSISQIKISEYKNNKEMLLIMKKQKEN